MQLIFRHLHGLGLDVSFKDDGEGRPTSAREVLTCLRGLVDAKQKIEISTFQTARERSAFEQMSPQEQWGYDKARGRLDD